MIASGLSARASGRLGLLSTLFIFPSFFPTGSGFQITSIGTFAQCVPTVITWDIGQSLPPFNISLTIASGSTDSPLLFAGFDGSSATVTFNLPAKTLVNVALVNSGGVLDQALNLVVEPGTDSSCANGAISGSVTTVISVSSLSGFPTETSDTSTSPDTSTPTINSSSASQLLSINHPSSTSMSASIIDFSVSEQSHSTTSTSTLRLHKTLRPSRTILSIKSAATPNPFDHAPSDSFSLSIPTPPIMTPLPSSLSSETSGKGLQPSVIGAIVTCSILVFALGLRLLFWWKRRRQYRREMRHTRLDSPELREVSIRDSVSVLSVQDSPMGTPNSNSPTSVNATIHLPSAEAIMEHRNKPLPTPDTGTLSSKARPGPTAARSATPLARSTRPMSDARVLTPRAGIAAFWDSQRRARRTQELGWTASGSIFDDAWSDVPSTAPPPYDQY